MFLYGMKLRWRRAKVWKLLIIYWETSCKTTNWTELNNQSQDWIWLRLLNKFFFLYWTIQTSRKFLFLSIFCNIFCLFCLNILFFSKTFSAKTLKYTNDSVLKTIFYLYKEYSNFERILENPQDSWIVNCFVLWQLSRLSYEL